MDTETIIAELEAERERLNDAITALQGSRKGPGRPRATEAASNGRRGPRKLSAAARKRISAAMRKKWAERKKQGKKAS